MEFIFQLKKHASGSTLFLHNGSVKKNGVVNASKQNHTAQSSRKEHHHIFFLSFYVLDVFDLRLSLFILCAGG